MQDIPINLEGIRDVLEECKAAGDDCVKKFRDVNKLMQEAMSKSQGKKQRTEAIKAEVDRKIEAGELEKDQREAFIKEMEDKIDKLEEQEEEEREKYNEALDSMNSAGAFFEGLVEDMVGPCMEIAKAKLCPGAAIGNVKLYFCL